MSRPTDAAPGTGFYRVIRALSKPLFALLFRLRREGPADVPQGAVIVAANHVSYLDPAVVGATFPRVVRFLIAEDVWRFRPLTWFYRAMLSIPVNRSGVARSALKAALALLQRGEVVGIFPEGGRVAAGAREGAMFGVALMARRSGAPVIPAGIRGTERAMPRGVALPRPVRVVVRYGAPLLYDDVARGMDRAAADHAFTEELMRRIRELADGEAA